MGGKWFANRGQVFQTVAAITSASVAIIALYFVLRSNNSLPKASAVLCAAGGTFLLLIGILIGRRFGPTVSGPSPSVPASGETKVLDSGNTTATGGTSTATGGNVHIVFPPSMAPAPVAIPASKPKVVQLEAMPLLTKWIQLERGQLTFGRRETDSGPALLLPIYFNAITSDSVVIENVRSHLVFNNSETGAKITVDHGFWISATLDYVEISPGEKKYLVVAVFNDDLSEARAISSNVTDYEWYNDYGNEPFDEERLALTDYVLQVVVSWSGSTRGKKIFEIPLTLKNIPKPLP
jgi:hypothetical protein